MSAAPDPAGAGQETGGTVSIPSEQVREALARGELFLEYHFSLPLSSADFLAYHVAHG